MKPGITFHQKTKRSHRSNWIPSFPNPADFRFDYYKLMADSPDGLADLRSDSARSKCQAFEITIAPSWRASAHSRSPVK